MLKLIVLNLLLLKEMWTRSLVAFIKMLYLESYSFSNKLEITHFQILSRN